MGALLTRFVVNKVNEIVINYTGCAAAGANEVALTGDLYSYKFTSDNSTGKEEQNSDQL